MRARQRNGKLTHYHPLRKSLSPNENPASSFQESGRQPANTRHCLSYTTTLFTARPCASLPLNVEVRVFPSLETFDITVITTWSPFFMVASIVLASMRFTDTVSTLGTPLTG